MSRRTSGRSTPCAASYPRPRGARNGARGASALCARAGGLLSGLAEGHVLAEQEDPAEERDRDEAAGVVEDRVAKGDGLRDAEHREGQDGGGMENADVARRRRQANAQRDERQDRPGGDEREIQPGCKEGGQRGERRGQPDEER